MPDIFDKYSHPKSESNPIIYVYTESYLPGYLKVGYTTKPVEERMKEIHPLKMPVKTWKVLFTTPALYPDGTVFTDHDVHKQLVNRGFKHQKDPDNKNTEFFKCSLDNVKAAIVAVKTHTLNEEDRTQTFRMRPEQAQAVHDTIVYFKSEKEADPKRSPKYLWNCKMRFGKTFAAYELAKQMGMKRVLVLTFKPAVEDSWETDLLTHVDFEGWQYYSAKYSKTHDITPESLDQKRPIVCFGSFQDYLGTDSNGCIKAKNEWVHTTNWDLVIFDEYHYGAWRENARKLFYQNDDEYDTLNIETYKTEEADNAYNESFLPITTDYYLFLSGTPFRALNTGEFVEDQIFSWTYSDEQKAKEDWPKQHSNEPNPYASLPRMIMMTYKMPEELEKVAKGGEFNEFDLNVFFSAKLTDPDDLNTAVFVYENEVQKWLDMIHGSYYPMSIDNLKRNKSERPVMPFSDVRLLNVLNHTLWFLPNVASCYAMRNLLAQPQNKFYHDYTVNLCAGSAAGIGLDAIGPVRDSMTPALQTKTITLSCGKLTTGVTIKPWTGILMLRNLSSPETYFQAAFRVQSPWTIKHEDGTEEIIKHDCYIFDFAINRALREISDYSCQLDIKETNPEKKVSDFIHFLPVLAFDGSAMTDVNAAEILDIVTSGTSASLLARRWQSALLVNVDNLTLDKLRKNEKALAALMNIEEFRSLNSDIETVINKSESVKKAKAENKETKPEYKKALSEEEKQAKSLRKTIQEKLIKLATRIPIFMYLTDYREMSLKDVIMKIEPNLFRKVTGLTQDDFEELNSIGVFNSSVMNDAIYKFKRYEDSSLEYAGVNMHSKDENVGLFDTVITREEYEELAKEQVGSTREQPSFAPEIIAATEPTIDDRPEDSLSHGTVIHSKNPEVPDVAEGMFVEHAKFGLGKITHFGGNRLTVKFLTLGEKKFVYPDAFKKGFLKIADND